MIPMRQHNDESYLKLRDYERYGILTYFGVPKRVVALEVAGKLGGDNNSDLTLFYYLVIRPLQRRLASILTYEFRQEGIAKDVKPDDFIFGNMIELLRSDDVTLFDKERNN